MEFDINKEIKEQIYEDKYFSEYINGISYYDPNRIDKNTYIITQKNIDSISNWIKNNPKTPWKDIDSNVYKFIKYDPTLSVPVFYISGQTVPPNTNGYIIPN